MKFDPKSYTLPPKVLSGELCVLSAEKLVEVNA